MSARVSSTRPALRRIVALLAVATLAALAAPVSGSERPNIVVLVADDLGWADLGSYGSTFHDTPSLDALAVTGLRFTSGYAAAPVCSPTRAALLSGKYPARMNTTDWFGGRRPGKLLPADYIEHLPLEEVTLAEALREAGYRTGFFGKWHLGGEGYHPEDQGFEVNKGGHAAGHPASYFWPYERPGGSAHDVPGLEEGGQEGEYLTDRLTSEALRFIETDRERPFLVYLSFYTVHTPIQGKPELVDEYREKARWTAKPSYRFVPEGRREARQAQDDPGYAAMVRSLDENVGRLLRRLEELEIDDETIIVFTSDNGGLSTSEGHPTSCLPLRAGKGWLYEGGIRVPTIVRVPGSSKAGATSDVPMSSVDLYPTLLDLAGLPLRPEQHVDGVSLAPILRGESATIDRALYWHYPHYGNQGGAPASAMRSGDWKLIEHFETGRVELFDLALDIGESRDVSALHPRTTERLRKQLDAWRREVDARLPSPNPKHRAPRPRALLIGDSISMGYTKPVQELLKDEVEVLRIPTNGGPTWKGLTDIDAWVGNGEWDVIHFNFGLHDLCYRHPLSKIGGRRDKERGTITTRVPDYERNLERIVERLERTGARLVFATTTPVPAGEPGRFEGAEADYNEAALRVMRRRGVAVNDLHAVVRDRVGELQRPGGDVHFRPRGSAALAEAVAAAIRAALEVGR